MFIFRNDFGGEVLEDSQLGEMAMLISYDNLITFARESLELCEYFIKQIFPNYDRSLFYLSIFEKWNKDGNKTIGDLREVLEEGGDAFHGAWEILKNKPSGGI